MRLIAFVTVCVSLTLPGCSSTTLLKTSASVVTAPVRAISGARRQKPVSRILCLWEPAEGQGIDGKPTRGFAGQIMFFSYGERSPIRVHGKVRVFEYADFDPEEPEPVPIHLFEFSDGGWNAHRSTGTLGESYNIFLPYVEKRNGQVDCGLRVEFETDEGKVISSPFTEITLARASTKAPAKALQRNIVRTESNRKKLEEIAAEQNSSERGSKPRRKLESTTIKLPIGTR